MNDTKIAKNGKPGTARHHLDGLQTLVRKLGINITAEQTLDKIQILQEEEKEEDFMNAMIINTTRP